jgi:hypothetical protein
LLSLLFADTNATHQTAIQAALIAQNSTLNGGSRCSHAPTATHVINHSKVLRKNWGRDMRLPAFACSKFRPDPAHDSAQANECSARNSDKTDEDYQCPRSRDRRQIYEQRELNAEKGKRQECQVELKPSAHAASLADFDAAGKKSASQSEPMPDGMANGIFRRWSTATLTAASVFAQALLDRPREWRF